MAVNWNKIKNEYINGDISYAKLAKKHKVSLQAIKDRGTREKWVAQKKEQQTNIQQITNQKTAEKIAEQESNLIIDVQNTAAKLLEKLNIAIEQTDLYIERTKIKVPTKVRDEKTGKLYDAYKESEEVRLAHKNGLNVNSLKQLASALKDIQSIQMAGKESVMTETPNINITIAPATAKDIEDEDE